MAIDYSRSALPKGTPQAVLKDQRARVRQAVDERESAKVKVRSGGQCEVRCPTRCLRRAVHVHHRIGGIGVRGRGTSALAKNKLHVCSRCHSDIHAHVLCDTGRVFTRLR